MREAPRELLLYAHRGDSAHRPENTLDAFRAALDKGADVLELDLHLTADGIPVVSHDPDGARLSGRARAFADEKWHEVLTWDAGFGFLAGDGTRPFAGGSIRFASFDDVLSAFPGVRLNVDLKSRDPRLAEVVVAQVTRHAAHDRVLLASFHDDVLARVRRIAPHLATGLGPAGVRRLYALPGPLLRWFPPQGQTVQVPVRAGRFRFDTPRFVARTHAVGLRLDVWTIDDPAEARGLLALGVDGLITNDPGTLRPVVDAEKRRRGEAGSHAIQGNSSRI